MKDEIKTEDLLRQIKHHIDIRQGLISLRAGLKQESAESRRTAEEIRKDNTFLTELLSDEDAKVRKNCALILGETVCTDAVCALYDAYRAEKQLFVRASYLEAIRQLADAGLQGTFATVIVPGLKPVLAELEAEETSEENRKHRAEERKLLRGIIESTEGSSKHTFIGYDRPAELVLLTNRNHVHVTTEQLKGVQFREFNAGIKLRTRSLKNILPIRTYEEVLFVIPGMESCPIDALAAAKIVAESGLMTFLKMTHSEDPPFSFRIEQRGSMDLEKKSRFTKLMADEIERLTKYRLVNSTGDYEFEIRMIESREDKYNLLVRLYTMPEERFAYRRESVSASIRPVNAALTMALVREYLKEDAQILDPFCGVGTMLIERAKILPAGTMYGLDIFGEAIEKARRNTELADLAVNYIHRDFFDFRHEYLFEEIITNMPVIRGKKEEDEIAALYRKFFVKVKEHLADDGIMVLYSHNRELVRKYGGIKPFRIEREFEISMREKCYVFVIRFCRPA